MKKKYRWTPREDKVLRDLYPHGGWPAVQRFLKERTIGGVRARLKTLNIARHWSDSKNKSVTKPSPDVVHEIKTRACLRCRKDFSSSWSGERICQMCKRAPTYERGMSEPVSRGRQVSPRGFASD